MLLTSAFIREHHAGVAVNPAIRACSPVSQGAQAPRFLAAFLCAHVFAPQWAGRAGHLRMRRFLESGLQTRTVPPTLLQGVAVLQSLLKEASMPKPRRTPAPCAPVISLAAYRTAHAPETVAECDPLDVLQAMVQGYFAALQVQLNRLRAERSAS